MTSTMSRPMILPNSVSSKDWSAAETNLDIVLIQFYRCKLCDNKFSSLSRSVVVAHMIQVHEAEWKVACAKIDNLKNKATGVIADGKKHEKLNSKVVSSPKRQFISKRVLADSTIACDSSQNKRSANSKLENVAKIQKTNFNVNENSLGKGATTNDLTDIINPGTVIRINCPGSVPNTNTTDTLGLAVLGVNNGIAYVAQVGQQNANVGQPMLSVGQPTVNAGQSIVDAGQSIVDVGQSSGNVEKPLINVVQPVVNVGQQSVVDFEESVFSVGQPIVNVGQSAASVGQSVVNIGQPIINVGQPGVNVHQPHANIGQPVVAVGQNISNVSGIISGPEEVYPDSMLKKIQEINCKKCGYVCSSWNELWAHSHEHLPKIQKVWYKCKFCKINFASESTLQEHRQKNPECQFHESANTSPELSCDRCSFKARSSQSLKIHRGAKHKPVSSNIQIVYCPACNARFQSTRSLRRHRKSGACGQIRKRGRPKGVIGKKRKPRPPSVPKVFECELCNRTFGKNSRYTDHYATHFAEKRQKCNMCDKAFKTKRSLRQHMIVHKGKKFACDICDFHTFWNDSLKKHKELKHFSENLPYHTCSICPYKSKDVQALKAHVKNTHREEKDYICETCGKSFKLVAALKCHQETHNKDAKYPCDQCQYIAKTRFNLYRHKSIHIAKDQLQFKCDKCTGSFRRSSELERHKRKHSDDKLYYCHHCGLGYKHKHGLNRHLKEKHQGNTWTTVEISETDVNNIYTDDIIVAQAFEV